MPNPSNRATLLGILGGELPPLAEAEIYVDHEQRIGALETSYTELKQQVAEDRAAVQKDIAKARSRRRTSGKG